METPLVTLTTKLSLWKTNCLRRSKLFGRKVRLSHIERSDVHMRMRCQVLYVRYVVSFPVHMRVVNESSVRSAIIFWGWCAEHWSGCRRTCRTCSYGPMQQLVSAAAAVGERSGVRGRAAVASRATVGEHSGDSVLVGEGGMGVGEGRMGVRKGRAL